MLKKLLYVLIVIACGFAYNWAAKRQCYARFAQYEPEYIGEITGCMINVDEQRVPASSFRMTM
jgi:hypothetical protein